jgi:hypothetical protein
MHKLKAFAVALVLLAGFANTASAQLATADHTVTVEVAAISEIAITGNATLTINSATAGSDPDGVTDTSTSYAVTTNESGVKITAETDVDMASGVTLAVNATAPAGATSAGSKTLSTSATDVVTGLGTVSQAGMSLGYSLSATAAAGQVASAAVTVTYTITN